MKLDSNDFMMHLNQIKRYPWLGQSREWWPDYVFHYTDVNNAASILNSGQLLSRQQSHARQIMVSDNASPQIINQTDERWKNYVRFYFRPRTPTQFRNEGIRVKTALQLGGAHCPVPVYFFFDSLALLCSDNSMFTSGSLASSSTEPMTTAREFRQLPFNIIYHDSAVNPDERASIVYHRHAELIIENGLSLKHLKSIWCRSPAELETLRNLLQTDVLKKWRNRLGVASKLNLFFKRWFYVDEAILSADRVVLVFGAEASTRGPFHAKIIVSPDGEQNEWVWEEQNYVFKNRIALDLSNVPTKVGYTTKFFLDGNLAYMGHHTDYQYPF